MDLSKVVAAQQELAKAQKLLDLPISVHLDLINVQKEMKGLKQIYDVYEAQKVSDFIVNLKWPSERFYSYWSNISRVSLFHLSERKVKVVSDLVGGFKHQSSTRGY